MEKKIRKATSGRNKTAVAKRVGESVDLRAWLAETEKDKDGKDVRKNTTDAIATELLAGTEGKDDKGRVTSLSSDNWTLTIELAKRKVPATKDGVLYEQEYASLLPLTADAAVTLMDGNLDVTKDDKGVETPSVLKYFRQGYGMLARNNAGAAIASLIEGPEKARERTILSLMKAKGWTREKAEAKYALLMED